MTSALGRLGLYAVLLCVVPFVLAEVVVRARGWAPRLPNQYRLYEPDPILPYRIRPNLVLEGRSQSDEFDFRYAHNSRGLRDREIPPKKPQGTLRILALGDSFAYGAGARLDKTFLSRLERMLNERDGSRPRVEIVKAGIPRFFPEAERLFLEHYGADFEPDHVLVVFVPNDVIDTAMGVEALEVLPDGRLVSSYGARLLARLGPATLWIYENLHVARIAMRWYLKKRVRVDNPVRWEEIYADDGFHEEAWREVEAQYSAMVAWARRNGAGITFVHVPLIGPWDERHAYPPERLTAWAKRTGVELVDILPALQERGVEGLYWPLDRHPTEEGHAVIAEVLAEALPGRGLIP